MTTDSLRFDPWGKEPEPDEQLDDRPRSYDEQLDIDVAKAARQLKINQLARERLDRDRRGPLPPFDAGTLGEILARGPAPVPRVEDLIPAEAGTLVVAAKKTGKTTLQLNLARSLIDGRDFLGKFGVRKIDGNVGFLNFEVSGDMLASWANEHRIAQDRLYMVNLRGCANPFRSPDELERLAHLLRTHDVETLIVDPFGRAYTGANQNDAGEVGAWLSELDQFARAAAGCTDLILAAHAGWNGERTRGSTALDDWADSIVTLTRDRDNDQQRFLKAEGRDVLIDEDQLTFDPTSRTLRLAGTGSRRTTAKIAQVERLMPVVLELLRDNEALTMSGNKLDEGIKKLIDSGDLDAKHSKGDGARAAQLLERRGLVGSKAGPRGARLFTLLTSPTSLNLPEGTQATSPPPLIGGGRQGSHHHHLPRSPGAAMKPSRPSLPSSMLPLPPHGPSRRLATSWTRCRASSESGDGVQQDCGGASQDERGCSEHKGGSVRTCLVGAGVSEPGQEVGEEFGEGSEGVGWIHGVVSVRPVLCHSFLCRVGTIDRSALAGWRVVGGRGARTLHAQRLLLQVRGLPLDSWTGASLSPEAVAGRG